MAQHRTPRSPLWRKLRHQHPTAIPLPDDERLEVVLPWVGAADPQFPTEAEAEAALRTIAAGR